MDWDSIPQSRSLLTASNLSMYLYPPRGESLSHLRAVRQLGLPLLQKISIHIGDSDPPGDATLGPQIIPKLFLGLPLLSFKLPDAFYR